MAILSKGRKLDNSESHNSLKFSFANIECLFLKIVEFGSFIESSSPDILALARDTWMTQLILPISL